MAKIDASNYGHIGITCLICGSFKELTKEEAEYNRHFGTISAIYICDSCKNAIEWAKIMKANTEDLKKYINSETLKSTNIQMDKKCVCCPYMFEYKCRKSLCMFDDQQEGP